MRNVQEKFELFFKNKAPTKKLLWLYAQGNCEIKTNYLLPKPYYLTTNVFQYLILDQFNNKDSIKYSDLTNYLSTIPIDDLNINLKYIFNPNRAIILKGDNKSPLCKPDEMLNLNLQFKFSSYQINLLTTNKGGQSIESNNKEQQNQIMEDRGIKLDCIIVRIMKGRKTELYNDIIAEVFHQSNMFKPDPIMIKQRIESLVEREFLKRDEQNRNIYHYLP